MSGDTPRFRLIYTKQAKQDAKQLSAAGLRDKTRELLTIIAHNPYQNPPRYERLVGNLKGAISRRINIQHRLVYQVMDNGKTVKVLRMWTHYE